MDIDHEAHRHDVPPSTVKGEAERTAAAEDRSDQAGKVLEEAKRAVGDDAGHAADPSAPATDSSPRPEPEAPEDDDPSAPPNG